MWLLAGDSLHTRLTARRSLLPLLAGSAALAVYLATLAPDLSWAFHATDGAELMTSAVTLGVPHPPGYPTYVLLGHLVSWLPIGAIPFRFNLFSALAMSVTVGFFVATATRLSARFSPGARVGAITAALTLAFLLPVWQQAIVAEVYALNFAAVSALIFVLLSRRSVVLVGLFLGLAMTTHATSLLLVPLVLALTPWRQWLRLGAAVLLGLAPLLALPLLAQSGSPVVWGEPQQLAGWWWLVTAELYRPNLLALPPGAMLARLGDWFWSQQLVVPSVILLLSASPLFRREEWPQARLRVALGVTALAYLLFAASYGTPDAAVLLLPGLACAILLLLPFCNRMGPAGLVLPALLLLLNFSQLDLRDDPSPRVVAEGVLQQAPPDAILLAEGDATTFTLWYLHEVERQRPDLAIIDRNLFGFDWYRRQLERRYAWMPHVPDYSPGALSELGRPLCSTRIDEGDLLLSC
jgi:hypothetical protein